MKPGGARVAVGIGLGYLLGRTRKMRLALMVAAAGLSGNAGSPRALVQQGLKQLASSPELSKIAETALGELLDAAKSAAIGVATSRIDSLSDRLQERAGVPGQAVPRPRREEKEPEGSAETEDETKDESKDETEEESRGETGDEAEPERAGEDRSGEANSGRRTPSGDSSRSPTAEDSRDEPRRATTRARAGAGRSPVRRTRR